MSNPLEQPFTPLSDMDLSRMQFSVVVRAEVMTPQKLRGLVPGETSYKAWCDLGFERVRCEEDAGDGTTYGEGWVYTFHQEGPGTLHTFFFAEKRTPAEIRRPVAHLSYATTDAHQWPDVVERLDFTEDPTMPMEVVVSGQARSVPTLYVRMVRIEGGSYASDIDVRIYVSHQKFPAATVKRLLDVPVPTPVHWEMVNSRGSLGACLHPYMEFPESQQGGNRFEAGTVREGSKFGDKQVFPETNHRRWKPHIYHVDHKQVRGLWVLEVRKVHPPKGIRRAVAAA